MEWAYSYWAVDLAIPFRLIIGFMFLKLSIKKTFAIRVSDLSFLCLKNISETAFAIAVPD